MSTATARAVRLSVGVVALLGLATLALTLKAAPPISKVAAPAAVAIPDRIAIVRGGIASSFAPGEELPVVRDVTATIVLRPVPGVRYARSLQVALADGAGPVAGATVRVAAVMRYMEHGDLRAVAVSAGDGTYAVALPFVMPGEWRLVITCEIGAEAGELVVDLDEYE